jgi:hypothetical protein
MSCWATRGFSALVKWENVKEILTAKMTSNSKHDLASWIRVYQKWIVINNFGTLP